MAPLRATVTVEEEVEDAVATVRSLHTTSTLATIGEEGKAIERIGNNIVTMINGNHIHFPVCSQFLNTGQRGEMMNVRRKKIPPMK